MFNWESNKGTLTELITYFNSKKRSISSRVLEIGTYTGVSLINIVKQIPNSRGQGIDSWSAQEKLLIEKSFQENVKREGLESKISGIKGDSCKVLLSKIKKNEVFDIIYIDLGYESLTDMVLAWQLLEKNGILAVNQPYSPAFLEKYVGEYLVLYRGNQLYLEKAS
jgi:predicted O-methyltransferase YrrM